MHPIQKLISDYHNGTQKGIYSCCSADALVIKAVMKLAQRLGETVLIEATANQVNQFGGYTGMTPADFVDYVYGIAQKIGFPRDKVILGGDHLGPLVWTQMDEQAAMEYAVELVRCYAAAGFTKIHIDTSMKVASDDPELRLSDEVIARRGALLCAAAEQGYETYRQTNPTAVAPVYVIGSEVPIPGGAQVEEEMQVTRKKDCENTIETFHQAFIQMGLSDAWDRVVGVVVQPGVEFGSFSIERYDRTKTTDLCLVLQEYPGLCFEAHSTDYQTPVHLRQLVEDGFLILKVGPALTFALREGLLALDEMEQELLGEQASHYRAILEDAMTADPSKWQKYYHGTETEQKFARVYSLSDRQRYYSSEPSVKAAQKKLIENLRKQQIPEVLISQYMPMQYEAVHSGSLSIDPEDLLCDYVIQRCASYYAFAASDNLS